MNNERIVVVGGGVAGLRTAARLAEKGISDVMVVEKQLRSPRSWFSLKHRLPSDVLSDPSLNQAIYPLNGTEFILFNEEDDTVRERFGINFGSNLAPDTSLMIGQQGLEKKLLMDATNAGVQIIHDSVMSASKNGHYSLELKEGGTIQADVLIDASGPESFLQRKLHLLDDDPIVMWMYGARMTGEFNPTAMLFPLTAKTGKASWIAPWSKDEADLIAADYCKLSEYQSRLPEFQERFQFFVELCKKHRICNPKEVENTIIGRIRVVPIKRPKYDEQVYAVGEAAGQSCPFMSEGVSSAFRQADNLSDVFSRDSITPKTYHDSWYKGKDKEFAYPTALALLMKRLLSEKVCGNSEVYKAILHASPEVQLRLLTERTIKPKDLPFVLLEAGLNPIILVQALEFLHKRLLLVTHQYDGYLWGNQELP